MTGIRHFKTKFSELKKLFSYTVALSRCLKKGILGRMESSQPLFVKSFYIYEIYVF